MAKNNNNIDANCVENINIFEFIKKLKWNKTTFSIKPSADF